MNAKYLSSLSSWLPAEAQGSPLLLPGEPPPVEPQVCATCRLQRPTTGSVSPPLQNKLQIKRKVLHLKSDIHIPLITISCSLIYLFFLYQTEVDDSSPEP